MCFSFLITVVLLLLGLCFIKINQGYAQTILPEISSHPNWKYLDYSSNCGDVLADRIIGGVSASLGQYPWMARLGYTDKWNGDSVDSYECGGVIISQKYVLTAAHCHGDMMNMNLVEVRLGEYNAEEEIDCMDDICAPPVQDIFVEKVICHGGFKKTTFENDICLLRLASPITFDEFVMPICLPIYDVMKNYRLEGAIMEVAGWGVNDINERLQSSILLSLKVPIVSNNVCIKRLKEVVLGDKQICAGGEIGKDSCNGDSGGPVMWPISVNGPPRYFLFGIVSFGKKACAASDAPGVYTLVPKYLKWILDNVRE